MKKIIIPILIVVLGFSVYFLFFRSNTKELPQTETQLEEYEEESEKYNDDLTNKFSDTQKAEMQNSAKTLINDYLKAFYTYDYTKTDKNAYMESLNQFSQPDNPEKDAIFDNLQKEEMVSQYIDFQDVSFTVLNETPEIQLLVLAHTKMQSRAFDKGEYSVLGRFTLTKADGEWFVRSFHPSMVYKYGTTKISDAEYEGYIHLDGEYVGEYQNSAKESESQTAAGDGYMEEQQNGTYEEFTEDMGDSTEEAEEEEYDSLEDAIANDFQESSPGMSD